MIHNTGPYGPTENPSTIAAQSMASVSNQISFSNNLDNFVNPQESSLQAHSSGFQGLDYSTYKSSALNLSTPVAQYQHYNTLACEKNYLNQNPDYLANNGAQTFHNGTYYKQDMVPNVPSGTFFNNLELEIKKQTGDQMFDSKEPLSDYRQPPDENTVNDLSKSNEKFNVTLNCESNSNIFDNESCLPKTETKIVLDSSRRRSLENTVKLIENILLHSSGPKNKKVKNKSNHSKKKSKKLKVSQDSYASYESNYELKTNDQQINTNQESNTNYEQCEEREEGGDANKCDETGKDYSINKDEDPLNCSMSQVEDLSMKMKDVSEIKEDPDKEECDQIHIKVEQVTTWTDTDFENPFYRDMNGFRKEDIGADDVLIDAETSIEEARNAILYPPAVKPFYECPQCILIFNHPKRFLLHTKWHSFGLTNAKRMELAKEKAMQRNMKREEKLAERITSLSDDQPIYHCKDCNRICASRRALQSHKEKAHANSERFCKVCKKTFPGRVALREHMLSHVNENRFQCDDCPKKFKYAHSLVKHRDTHLEKTYGCDQCPKKFGSFALLRTHKRTHERAARGANHKCSLCDAAFFEKYSLVNHERTHRNERPFTCDICFTSFHTKSTLKRHLRVSHSKSTKPFECSTCHRCFSTETIRDNHEARVHGNPEDLEYACKHCDSRFLKESILKKHVYKFHPKGKRRKRSSDSE